MSRGGGKVGLKVRRAGVPFLLVLVTAYRVQPRGQDDRNRQPHLQQLEQELPRDLAQVVRVVDQAPKRLAGTTAVVFAQVTVQEDGAPVGESEDSRKQEFCKVAITER